MGTGRVWLCSRAASLRDGAGRVWLSASELRLAASGLGSARRGVEKTTLYLVGRSDKGGHRLRQQRSGRRRRQGGWHGARRWRPRRRPVALLLSCALPQRLVFGVVARRVDPGVELLSRRVLGPQLLIGALPLGHPIGFPFVARLLVRREPQLQLRRRPFWKDHLLGDLVAVDLLNLHHEDQARCRRDLRRLAICPVRQLVRDVHCTRTKGRPRPARTHLGATGMHNAGSEGNARSPRRVRSPRRARSRRVAWPRTHSPTCRQSP